ncbi:MULTISPECIES: hypothetical protein [unclassified Nostoc]|uniref:hypothetical protein n=1 Tax=unclassified Nostoc TaxID=2593658 RepID=UPI002AD3CA4E|nr:MULTISPECIES: hypothetical protein [unclassified Nostoc]MDZ8125825.1 hypothetical protein [Nostoc sp. CmiVER01]MDZ8225902.1 hypothetical protein [Nostoc sp. ChiVER01]
MALSSTFNLGVGVARRRHRSDWEHEQLIIIAIAHPYLSNKGKIYTIVLTFIRSLSFVTNKQWENLKRLYTIEKGLKKIKETLTNLSSGVN